MFPPVGTRSPRGGTFRFKFPPEIVLKGENIPTGGKIGGNFPLKFPPRSH